MRLVIRSLSAICVATVIAVAAVPAIAQQDPLPSCNDTDPKEAALTLFAADVRAQQKPNIVVILGDNIGAVTADVQAIVRTAHLCFAATVTPEGRPNVSTKKDWRLERSFGRSASPGKADLFGL